MMHAATTGEHVATGHIRRALQREMVLGLWRSTITVVAGATTAFVRWRHKKQAIAELHDLSDRMLSDIGIKRHDIERIVWNGRGAGEFSR